MNSPCETEPFANFEDQLTTKYERLLEDSHKKLEILQGIHEKETNKLQREISSQKVEISSQKLEIQRLKGGFVKEKCETQRDLSRDPSKLTQENKDKILQNLL